MDEDLDFYLVIDERSREVPTPSGDATSSEQNRHEEPVVCVSPIPDQTPLQQFLKQSMKESVAPESFMEDDEENSPRETRQQEIRRKEAEGSSFLPEFSVSAEPTTATFSTLTPPKPVDIVMPTLSSESLPARPEEEQMSSSDHELLPTPAAPVTTAPESTGSVTESSSVATGRSRRERVPRKVYEPPFTPGGKASSLTPVPPKPQTKRESEGKSSLTKRKRMKDSESGDVSGPSPKRTKQENFAPAKKVSPLPAVAPKSGELFPRREGIEYAPKARLDVQDDMDKSKWYPSRIVEVDWSDGTLLVHFDYWNSKFDEWIPANSERLRPCTVSVQKKPEVKFKVGDYVLARFNQNDGVRLPAKLIEATAEDDKFLVLFYDGFQKQLKTRGIVKMTPDQVAELDTENFGKQVTILPQYPDPLFDPNIQERMGEMPKKRRSRPSARVYSPDPSAGSNSGTPEPKSRGRPPQNKAKKSIEPVVENDKKKAETPIQTEVKAVTPSVAPQVTVLESKEALKPLPKARPVVFPQLVYKGQTLVKGDAIPVSPEKDSLSSRVGTSAATGRPRATVPSSDPGARKSRAEPGNSSTTTTSVSRLSRLRSQSPQKGAGGISSPLSAMAEKWKQRKLLKQRQLKKSSSRSTLSIGSPGRKKGRPPFSQSFTHNKGKTITERALEKKVAEQAVWLKKKLFSASPKVSETVIPAKGRVSPDDDDADIPLSAFLKDKKSPDMPKNLTDSATTSTLLPIIALKRLTALELAADKLDPDRARWDVTKNPWIDDKIAAPENREHAHFLLQNNYEEVLQEEYYQKPVGNRKRTAVGLRPEPQTEKQDETAEPTDVGKSYTFPVYSESKEMQLRRRTVIWDVVTNRRVRNLPEEISVPEVEENNVLVDSEKICEEDMPSLEGFDDWIKGREDWLRQDKLNKKVYCGVCRAKFENHERYKCNVMVGGVREKFLIRIEAHEISDIHALGQGRVSEQDLDRKRKRNQPAFEVGRQKPKTSPFRVKFKKSPAASRKRFSQADRPTVPHSESGSQLSPSDVSKPETTEATEPAHTSPGSGEILSQPTTTGSETVEKNSEKPGPSSPILRSRKSGRSPKPKVATPTNLKKTSPGAQQSSATRKATPASLKVLRDRYFETFKKYHAGREFWLYETGNQTLIKCRLCEQYKPKGYNAKWVGPGIDMKFVSSAVCHHELTTSHRRAVDMFTKESAPQKAKSGPVGSQSPRYIMPTNVYACPSPGCLRTFRKQHLLDTHLKNLHDGAHMEPAQTGQPSEPSLPKLEAESSDNTEQAELPTVSATSEATRSSVGEPPQPATVSAKKAKATPPVGLTARKGGRRKGGHKQPLPSATHETKEESSSDYESDEDQNLDLIRCICEDADSTGFMIQCDHCSSWQHGRCFGWKLDSDVPEDYICYMCKNPPRARESRQAQWAYEKVFLKSGKLPHFRLRGKEYKQTYQGLTFATSQALNDCLKLQMEAKAMRRRLDILRGDTRHPDFLRCCGLESLKGLSSEDVRRIVSEEERKIIAQQMVISKRLDSVEKQLEDLENNWRRNNPKKMTSSQVVAAFLDQEKDYRLVGKVVEKIRNY